MTASLRSLRCIPLKLNCVHLNQEENETECTLQEKGFFCINRVKSCGYMEAEIRRVNFRLNSLVGYNLESFDERHKYSYRSFRN